MILHNIRLKRYLHIKYILIQFPYLATILPRIEPSYNTHSCQKVILVGTYIFNIYFACLYVCLNPKKRQNGWTDRARILRVTSHYPKEGLWMIKNKKISLPHNFIFIKFWKSTNFFIKSANFCLFLFYKKKMFTIDKKKMGAKRPDCFALYIVLARKPSFLHYTLYIIQYTLYNIHYTIYNIHYTIYNIHYTIYIIHWRKPRTL